MDDTVFNGGQSDPINLQLHDIDAADYARGEYPGMSAEYNAPSDEIASENELSDTGNEIADSESDKQKGGKSSCPRLRSRGHNGNVPRGLLTSLINTAAVASTVVTVVVVAVVMSLSFSIKLISADSTSALLSVSESGSSDSAAETIPYTVLSPDGNALLTGVYDLSDGSLYIAGLLPDSEYTLLLGEDVSKPDAKFTFRTLPDGSDETEPPPPPVTDETEPPPPPGPKNDIFGISMLAASNGNGVRATFFGDWKPDASDTGRVDCRWSFGPADGDATDEGVIEGFTVASEITVANVRKGRYIIRCEFVYVVDGVSYPLNFDALHEFDHEPPPFDFGNVNLNVSVSGDGRAPQMLLTAENLPEGELTGEWRIYLGTDSNGEVLYSGSVASDGVTAPVTLADITVKGLYLAVYELKNEFGEVVLSMTSGFKARFWEPDTQPTLLTITQKANSTQKLSFAFTTDFVAGATDDGTIGVDYSVSFKGNEISNGTLVGEAALTEGVTLNSPAAGEYTVTARALYVTGVGTVAETSYPLELTAENSFTVDIRRTPVNAPLLNAVYSNNDGINVSGTLSWNRAAADTGSINDCDLLLISGRGLTGTVYESVRLTPAELEEGYFFQVFFDEMANPDPGNGWYTIALTPVYTAEDGSRNSLKGSTETWELVYVEAPTNPPVGFEVTADQEARTATVSVEWTPDEYGALYVTWFAHNADFSKQGNGRQKYTDFGTPISFESLMGSEEDFTVEFYLEYESLTGYMGYSGTDDSSELVNFTAVPPLETW